MRARHILAATSTALRDVPVEGGGGGLLSIGYTGMCRWKGYGFQAFYSGIGSSNRRKLVWNRVPFNGIAKRTKIAITKD